MFFSNFYSNLSDIYNSNIIVNKSFASRRKIYDKPWMSTSLAKCCKEKIRLHNVWIKSRGSSYENFAKINYKSYRRILRSLIRKSENDYFMAKFNKVSGNIRIFIDFSKAFDTIKHNILLHKLSHYGIRGLAYDLMSDYLSSRKQYVTYDANTCSSLLPVSIGVPQGSVLGHLFFIIYVNDLVNCGTDSVKFIMFADDTNIFISASNIHELYHTANYILSILKNYIDANYLHINLKKSKYI